MERLPNYGVLVGTPVAGKIISKDPNHPHYHILVKANGQQFDIAMNVLSYDGSEVLELVDNNFTPANEAGLKALSAGHTRLNGEGVALDYIRQLKLTPDKMVLLPLDETVPGSHSQLDTLVQNAIQQKATVYAFGQLFGNGKGFNNFFNFSPDQGIHDIHMNQGNPVNNRDDENGTYQDGGLIFSFPDGTWAAAFSAFQSQSFNTDDNGDPA
jgi:uncharacterized protein YukJ